METPQIPPPHTHRVLRIILPREKKGDKGRRPLELVLDWLWGQLTIVNQAKPLPIHCPLSPLSILI